MIDAEKVRTYHRNLAELRGENMRHEDYAVRWTEDEMTPGNTAVWFKQQDEYQKAPLRKHKVWYPGGPPRPATLDARATDEATQEIWTPSELSRRIIHHCAEFVGVSVKDLVSRSRVTDIAQARMAAAFLLKEHCTHLSLTGIGRKLGGRDHSTMGNARNMVMSDLARGGRKYGRIVAYVEERLTRSRCL